MVATQESAASVSLLSKAFSIHLNKVIMNKEPAETKHNNISNLEDFIHKKQKLCTVSYSR